MLFGLINLSFGANNINIARSDTTTLIRGISHGSLYKFVVTKSYWITVTRSDRTRLQAFVSQEIYNA